MNQFTRPQLSARPSPSQTSYRSPQQDVPVSGADPPSAFTPPSPPLPHTSPTPLRQRASYAGLQYPLHHPHPSLHVVHSAPHFAFPPHPGTPGHETNMQHLGYAPHSIMSVLRRQAHVFPSQGPSPDPALSSRHTFTTSPALPMLPVYPHSPVNPSPPPHSPLSLQQASTGPSGGMWRPTPYSSPNPYAPVGYTTPPPHAYPQTSFMPAHALSIYGSQSPPSHYAQSYGSPPSQGNRGTWWYLPQDVATAYSQSQPNSVYPPPIQQHEDERPGQSRTGTSLTNASPSQKPLFRSRSGAQNPNPEATSSSPSTQIKNAEGAPSAGSKSDSHHERRSYHPNPPVDRSEWVMWAGNVPSDATHDELRDFFNQSSLPLSPGQSESLTKPVQTHGGVSSIFQIPRSNCAFINFDSEAQLEAAIARFHGTPIRPDDPRCPRLVCRIRRRTDDLKAGVGAQRGSGMHIKWIREQKAKASRKWPDLVAPLTDSEEASSPLSISDDDSVGRGSSQASSTSRSSRSGSFASTNSDILSCYFPRRYFILKSLAQDDLDLSVQKNFWATQRHNEEILDQAYRTSKDVFLIFSVNKSGEFYGYARMTGPIFQGEVRVPWASRFTAPAAHDENANLNQSPLDTKAPRYVLPPEEQRVVGDSPQAISSLQDDTLDAKVHTSSAPAELREPHQKLLYSAPKDRTSLPRTVIPLQSSPFELNADAPYQAMKNFSAENIHRAVDHLTISEREGAPQSALDSSLQTVTEEPTKEGYAPEAALGEEPVAWGRAFNVNWIRTERLPFFRTRRLRNPWNHGREVKVSRDGTELEPSVGQRLLEEWDKPPQSPPPGVSATPSLPTPRRRGPKAT